MNRTTRRTGRKVAAGLCAGRGMRGESPMFTNLRKSIVRHVSGYLLLASVVAPVSNRCHAGTLRVPADYPTIGAAIAAAKNGDRIVVYVAYQLPLPALTDPLPSDLRRTAFPGGNSGLARYF